MRFLQVLFLLLLTIPGYAQNEENDKKLSGNNAAIETMDFKSQLLADSSKTQLDGMPAGLPSLAMDHQLPTAGLTGQYATESGKLFGLWQGGHLSINGTSDRMTGLMDFQAGSLALHQNLGRLHITASATADKYWMPMQSSLYTQYGFGGSLDYALNNSISLHAFAHYYTGMPLVGPALSPYINTTTYGGYADVRFNEYLGSSFGVRRYLNPMSGHWTTEPIVTPYIRIGKRSKIGIPLGGLLKAAIWGDRDNPLRFQPRPLPVPQPKK